eukprot:4457049-Alexandrium_andersonii.AAC.1
MPATRPTRAPSSCGPRLKGASARVQTCCYDRRNALAVGRGLTVANSGGTDRPPRDSASEELRAATAHLGSGPNNRAD